MYFFYLSVRPLVSFIIKNTYTVAKRDIPPNIKKMVLGPPIDGIELLSISFGPPTDTNPTINHNKQKQIPKPESTTVSII